MAKDEHYILHRLGIPWKLMKINPLHQQLLLLLRAALITVTWQYRATSLLKITWQVSTSSPDYHGLLKFPHIWHPINTKFSECTCMCINLSIYLHYIKPSISQISIYQISDISGKKNMTRKPSLQRLFILYSGDVGYFHQI